MSSAKGVDCTSLTASAATVTTDCKPAGNAAVMVGRNENTLRNQLTPSNGRASYKELIVASTKRGCMAIYASSYGFVPVRRAPRFQN